MTQSNPDSVKEILVWGEQRDGRLVPVALEILNKARELAGPLGARVSAVVIGADCGACAAELVAHGADRVFAVEDARLGLYQSDAFTAILCRIVGETRPGLVLLGATSVGADLAPAAAARLATGLTAHCTDVHMEAIDGREQPVMTVPGWRGNMMVKIVCPEKRPVMATIRAGVMEKGVPDPSRQGEIVAFDAGLADGDFRARTLEWVPEAGEGELEQARVVASGGFGFYEAGGTALLEELALAAGGVTAGTRPACDAGWVPESRLIGQSGRTVSPDLFISVGASGAPHYTTGFAKSKIVVAVDRNPKAPVFDVADFGIAGDLREVLPALVEELRRKT